MELRFVVVIPLLVMYFAKDEVDGWFRRRRRRRWSPPPPQQCIVSGTNLLNSPWFFIDCDKLELFVSTSSLLILVTFVTALCISFKECWLFTPDYQKVYESTSRVFSGSIESNC